MPFEDIRTESPRPLGFVLSEAEHGRSRDEVTILTGEGVLQPGTVLGKVTASGKWVASPNTGADGSQTGAAVLAYAVDATSADAQAVVIARAAQVKVDELLYDSTVDDATKRGAKHTQLASAGIIVR